MTTGSNRVPSWLVCAGIAAVALVLGGCEDNSPVAAPTSTLPPPASGVAEPTPTVPAYETELDLSDEEKKAAEAALVAFDGYIGTINRVLSSGGKDMENIDEFARGGSLKSLTDEARAMEAEGQFMAGSYGVYDLKIEGVELAIGGENSGKITITFCTRDSEWGVVNQGESLPSQSVRGITMQHVATEVDGVWKIANQYLRSKDCESL